MADDIFSIIDYESLTNIQFRYPLWGDNVLWAYASLQMIGATLASGHQSFDRISYMVRAKAFKAYREGRWNVHDMYRLNKEKIRITDTCWYCGCHVEANELTADHVFPRAKGGTNEMENIIFVCRSCNSSKGKRDLIEWMLDNKLMPSYNVSEHYLKEIYFHTIDCSLMNIPVAEVVNSPLPFNPRSVLLFQHATFLKSYLASLSPDS